MKLFSDSDLSLIERLEYRPGLKPTYDPMKNFLVWEDEQDFNLSPAGWEMINDLLFARSFIHRNLDFFAWPLGPEHYKSSWEQAIHDNLKWPGLKRLVLSEEDKIYYLDQMKKYSGNAGTL